MAGLIVDADTHLDEHEGTWDYLRPEEAVFRPRPLEFAGAGAFVAGDARPHRLWQIDGQFRLRRFRDDVRTGTTKATRELLDVEQRLRHMDALGVDVQVLYPTLFLFALTHRPEVELALCRAYNRWLAEATAAAKGRLRWVAILPWLSMDKAVEELGFAVSHGACGVFKKAIEAGNRPASDPYFFPVYHEAERLNVPICIHVGNGDPAVSDANVSLSVSAGISNQLTISAFTQLVVSGTPDKFTTLRFGWIEAAASWVPYLIHDLEAKRKRLNALEFDLKSDLLRTYRLYVTCDTTDDLPYILQYGAEDSLIIGSDYCHADQSAEIDALNILRSKGERGEIPPAMAQKIVSDNAVRFYGL